MENQSTPQKGLTTSSGQFTAIFALVALILSALGYTRTPIQVESWADTANTFVVTLGPLLAIIPVLIRYITSRGKITSNTINANASIALGGPPPTVVTDMSTTNASATSLAGLGDGIDFKDPETYESLLRLAKEFGVPGADKANKVAQDIHPAALIKGILSIFGHGKHKDK